jgi:N-acetylmuramoyl-L-alanine amidase
MRKINKIVIHCSDSEFGNASLIREWHTKERGWQDIGYHYVITNGIVESAFSYDEDKDGVIEEGRPLEISGAHVKGHNKNSVGVCLIGKHHFTGKQLYNALPTLLRLLISAYKLSVDDVCGHTELDSNKTCPNFAVENLLTLLKEKIL